MNQTAKNIKHYESLLPKMKERVIAMVMMLALSASLMVSVSFAWVTLSRNPEVSGLATTISGNGSLEIALSGKDGSQPSESQIGDSMAANGQTIPNANLTWGNLINLNDPSYGLQHLELRPAVLNEYTLLSNPLRAVNYGADGRVTTYLGEFGYASGYDAEYGVFRIPVDAEGNTITEYGIRAVSSVVYSNVEGTKDYTAIMDKVYGAIESTETSYGLVFANSSYMATLADLIGVYVSSQLPGKSEDITCNTYLPNLYSIAVDVQAAYEKLGEAYCHIAEGQMYISQGKGNYTLYTVDTLCEAAENNKLVEGVAITELNKYAADRKSLATQVDKVLTLKTRAENGETIVWNDLAGVVNFLVQTNNVTINGLTMTQIKNDITGSISKVLGDQPAKVLITQGFLYNFDGHLRRENHLKVEGMTIKIQYALLGNPSIKANVFTTSTTQAAMDDYAKAAAYDSGFKGTNPVAQDTYALAMDFWVRTNSPNEFMVLEGDVIKDSDGNVIGYVGSNRIWEDYINTTNGQATTQGSGSCYVFTCDDPADYDRTMELLQSFSIAFVDDQGNLLAHADMDTDNVWANAGRYTVPLIIREEELADNHVPVVVGTKEVIKNYYRDTQYEMIYVAETDSYYYVDDEGNQQTATADDITQVTVHEEVTEEKYYITQLKKNVPQRITAIIYLNGQKLTNEQVMAAAGIEGKLNIQFGGLEVMESLDNEKLYGEYIQVTAKADKTELNYDNAEDLSSLITVNVEGDLEATSVTGYFLRAINNYQGTRQEIMQFQPQSDGTWTYDMEFAVPGKYKLTHITVNGRDYELDNPVEITVEGFAMGNILWNYSEDAATVFSGDKSTSVSLNFSFQNANTNVRTVRGLFMTEDGKQVSIPLRRNDSGQWVGSGTITSSGVYTLEYIYIDGEAYEVPADKQKVITTTLGVTSQTWISSEAFETGTTRFTLEGDYASGATVKTYTVLLDDSGAQLGDLENVRLHYAHTTDSMAGVATDDMVWDQASGMYSGTFFIGKAGYYEFDRVQIGTSVITNTVMSPTITCVSPVPPSFYSAEGNEAFQFKPDGGATLTVKISDAATLKIKAIINGQEVYGKPIDEVTINGSPVTTFSFDIPQNAYGKQDGVWTLTELKLTDFYDKDQHYWNPGNEEQNIPAEWETWDIDDIQTKVIQTVNVQVEVPDVEDAVANNGNVVDFVDIFMADHTVSGFKVIITDYAGNAINDGTNNLVSDVLLEYQFATNDTDFGYTAVSSSTTMSDKAAEAIAMTTTETVAGKEYTFSAMNMKYAGLYAGSLTFKVNGETYGIHTNNASSGKGMSANLSNLPGYKTTWTNPTVEFTNVTPQSADRAWQYGSGCNPEKNIKAGYWKNEWTRFTVNIYPSQSWGDFKVAANITLPQVSAKVSGLGEKYTSATCMFTFGDHSNVFTFKPENEHKSTIYMGAQTSPTGRDDTFYTPNGAATQSIVVKYNDIDFTFTLTNKLSVASLTSDLTGPYEGKLD